ncbi:hypothetical protein COHA_001238 [Chlorella ohadii]|uniref:SAP domain-containing protein n=1 Tax=Chlorella ohadii TaxID=2649997 RepID=A0AAD5H5N0_9CHLO|nr:hypothetical protein COHA_001238 [Chlorella ohadii]
MAPTATEVGELLKPLLLKDLRIQCRARGINPGGSREALLERVRDHMLETGNLDLAAEFNGEVAIGVPQAKAASGQPDGPIGVANNNYVRDQGQNVGNFITDRPSSRVLAPPGGVTSWSLGGDMAPPAPKPRPAAGPASHPVELTAVATAEPVAPAAPSSEGGGEGVGLNNNYSRPQGQNVGNFITDKPSSRVLAPPGGGSSIVFG